MRRLLLLIPVFLLCLPGLAIASPVSGRVVQHDLAPGARPQALVAGPDGNIWFAGLRYVPGGFADIVGRVTPQGQVTEFTIGVHSDNLGLSDITVGPDGNLWFTEGGRPKVGRITTSGQITEFQIPSGKTPAQIASGSDGNLWFTEERASSVGRITPSGEVTEFPLPEGDSGSFGIAAGPDGALWITEPEAGRIARIGTDGAASSFPLPDPGGYPPRIIAGPDGALWFGKRRGGVLGRITTAGQVTELPVPGGRQTFALSTGPFGDIWYSNGAGKIGSITPQGATATPACIDSCQRSITDLAEGPEGRLWFAAGVAPMTLYTTPGTVGTFAPPPLEARILADPRLRGRTVLVRVRCLWGAAGNRCRGRIQLFGPGRLSERSFNLGLGVERRLALQLPGSAVRRLAERDRPVRVTTKVAGGRRDSERSVLASSGP